MSKQQPICLSSDESSEDEDSMAWGRSDNTNTTTPAVIDLLAPNSLDQTPPQQQKRKLCAQAAAGRKVATLKRRRIRLRKGVANDNEGTTTRKWREQRQEQQEHQEHQERQDELFARQLQQQQSQQSQQSQQEQQDETFARQWQQQQSQQEQQDERFARQLQQQEQAPPPPPQSILARSVAALREIGTLYLQQHQRKPVGTMYLDKSKTYEQHGNAYLASSRALSQGWKSFWENQTSFSTVPLVNHDTIKRFALTKKSSIKETQGFGKYSLWIVQEVVSDINCKPYIQHELEKALSTEWNQALCTQSSTQAQTEFYKNHYDWNVFKLPSRNDPPPCCFCRNGTKKTRLRHGKHGPIFRCDTVVNKQASRLQQRTVWTQGCGFIQNEAAGSWEG